MSYSTKVKCLDMFSQVQLGIILCDYFSQLPVKHNDHNLKIYLFVYQTGFFLSFQKSLAHQGLELHLLHLCLRQPAHDFSSVSVCRFHSFSKDTVGFRVLPDPVWLHLKYICTDSVSKIRPHSGVSRIWIWGLTTEPMAVGKVLKMEGTSAAEQEVLSDRTVMQAALYN